MIRDTLYVINYYGILKYNLNVQRYKYNLVISGNSIVDSGIAIRFTILGNLEYCFTHKLLSYKEC